jgi:hypothetical protein
MTETIHEIPSAPRGRVSPRSTDLATAGTSSTPWDRVRRSDYRGQHPAVGYAVVERLTSVLIGRLQVARVRLLDLYGNDSDR